MRRLTNRNVGDDGKNLGEIITNIFKIYTFILLKINNYGIYLLINQHFTDIYNPFMFKIH